MECGFDKFVNVDSDINFLGKEKLIKIKSEVVSKKLMGVKLDLKKINITESIDIMDENNNLIGELRSGCYSPYFDQVIGIAMLNKPNWNANQAIKIKINDQAFDEKFVIYLLFSIKLFKKYHGYCNCRGNRKRRS